MSRSGFKCLLVAVFSLIFTLFSNFSFARQNEDSTGQKKKESFDVNEVIFGHIGDGHEFHFFSYKSGGKDHEVTIPLPVILYSPQKGLSFFMSSKFHHGEESYKGYRVLNKEYLEKLKEEKINLEKEGLTDGKIIAVDANDNWDRSVKVYDFSLTRNVTQMILALALLVWIMLTIAKKYNKGEGVKNAPKGIQNLWEPVIIFIRDDVAKPNLNHKYEKYLPYLLTVFFFILINNIIGLIPGTANVTGNIAFTMLLALISFIVILFSTNKHYWKHIFWPPVPHGVKPILIPVEILGVFTKPFALMIRLFANMVAGHIIILSLVSLIFIMGVANTVTGYAVSPFAIAFVIFIYFIEILVAFLQAYIFTMLTAVFIGQAFESAHHEEKVHV